MASTERIPATELPASDAHAALAGRIRAWGSELGFQQVGITDTDLSAYREAVRAWVAAGNHGDMQWMETHLEKRLHPAALESGTIRVITARMDYLPDGTHPQAVLADRDRGYISRYALGRDYHKLMRRRLARLADRIREHAGGSGRYRAFVDSAPVLEKPLAARSGLGWQGKHTLLINREGGSWFFLGEIYTDLPLPVDPPWEREHCGSCNACIDACPTGAITGPWEIDARRCISYLTIEHHGPVPEELRPLVGNRVFGCDDCQLACPWNRDGMKTRETGFAAREALVAPDLVELFEWDEETWLRNTEGSPLRRLGYARWIRNVATALGNARPSRRAAMALERKMDIEDPAAAEHIAWALGRQREALRAG